MYIKRSHVQDTHAMRKKTDDQLQQFKESFNYSCAYYCTRVRDSEESPEKESFAEKVHLFPPFLAY